MKNNEKKKVPTKHIFFFFTIFTLVFGSNYSAFSGDFREITHFGSNPGNLKMFSYAPEDMPVKAPLVVSLHGCKQDAATYSTNGWKELADYYKFYVLFPEQIGDFFSGNNSLSCFNWFDPADTKRNSGEAKSIKSMIDQMLADHSIDQKRIFVEGLSAGGYMTAILLAAYPDVFEGGAINAGGPSYCASNSGEAFQCMSPGVDRSPEEWARLVQNQGYSGYTGPWPMVSIWHGSTDSKVVPLNQKELVDQWTSVHGIDQEPDKSEDVSGYPHKEYHDDQGNVLVETWSITGMGHATAIDPDFELTNGCGNESSYIKDKNICSVYHISRFWGLDKSDTEPPEVVITSPSENQSISGVIDVLVAASDNERIVKVQYLVGDTLRGEINAAPFVFSWDSSQEQNGRRTLIVRGYDGSGNMGEASVDVIVVGGQPDNIPCRVTAEPGGGTFQKTVTVSLSTNEEATIYYTTDGSTVDLNSSIYEVPLTFTKSTALSFLCKDTAENVSETNTIAYNIPVYEEIVNATSTMHYNAGRLNLDNYISAGRIYGYIDNFNLYRFDKCWTDDIHGNGDLGVCISSEGSDCLEWTDTNENHKKNLKANRSWSYYLPLGFGYRYYALGSKDALGEGTEVTTLHKEDPAQEIYHLGPCL